MATNSAVANYQEIVDISTTPSKVGIFGIHTPDSMKPVQMLEGFFRQFRQFKYIGCDVKIQPAATLPMDPLGVSYEAGEVSTDPRDLLNPIMVKGCHGETINSALDQIYHDNSSVGVNPATSLTRKDLNFTLGEYSGESAYYSALSDPSFKKFSVLQPFALRGLHPLVHKVVGTMPIYPRQSDADADEGAYLTGNGVAEDSEYNYFNEGKGSSSYGNLDAGPVTRIGDSGYYNGTFFTSKMERLGWLDTIARPQQMAYNRATITNLGGSFQWGVSADVPLTSPGYKFNTIPRLFMSMMIMPPCYKSILTFRVVINHKFAFRGFSTARFVDSSGTLGDYEEDLADVSSASAVNAVQDLSIPESTSVEPIDGTAVTLTEGVY